MAVGPGRVVVHPSLVGGGELGGSWVVAPGADGNPVLIGVRAQGTRVAGLLEEPVVRDRQRPAPRRAPDARPEVRNDVHLVRRVREERIRVHVVRELDGAELSGAGARHAGGRVGLGRAHELSGERPARVVCEDDVPVKDHLGRGRAGAQGQETQGEQSAPQRSTAFAARRRPPGRSRAASRGSPSHRCLLTSRLGRLRSESRDVRPFIAPPAAQGQTARDQDVSSKERKRRCLG